MTVCREARAEALKLYTQAFDTCIDLEHDTIFISDPVFSIRKPRAIFMNMEHVNELKNIAFSSDICRGLAEMHEDFSELCDSPGRVLRQFEGLTIFTIVLSVDGLDGGGYLDGASESPVNGMDDDEIDVEDRPESHEDEQDFEEDEGYDDGERETDDEVLDKMEKEALATMSKGYFRQVGDIHFASPRTHPDYMESCMWFGDDVVHSCILEKREHPEFIRPKVSIMAIKYGLNWIGDYSERELHSLGDHKDGVVGPWHSDEDDDEEAVNDEDQEYLALATEGFFDDSDDEEGLGPDGGQ